MKLAYSGDYEGCFVCGKHNEEGLKLEFFLDEADGEMCARCTFPRAMQGYENIVHGGFLSMLLDEAMAKACIQRGMPAVTARIEVRFKKPVLAGEEIEVRGKVVEARGRKIVAQARVLAGGETRALGEGLFIRTE